MDGERTKHRDECQDEWMEKGTEQKRECKNAKLNAWRKD